MKHETLFALAIVLIGNAGAQTVAPWPADAPKYRLHVIGQGHLDAVWLWPWHEALSEVHSTCRSILTWIRRESIDCCPEAARGVSLWVASEGGQHGIRRAITTRSDAAIVDEATQQSSHSCTCHEATVAFGRRVRAMERL